MEKGKEKVIKFESTTDCIFMNVSTTNVSDKHHHTVFWDSNWLVYLTTNYCYPVWSNAVSYLHVKRDNGHVACAAYWNWLQWKAMYFVCILYLYKPAFDIMVSRIDIKMNISLVYIYIYISIHPHTHTHNNNKNTHTYLDFESLLNWKIDVRYCWNSTRIQCVIFQQSVSSTVTTCNSSYTVP